MPHQFLRCFHIFGGSHYHRGERPAECVPAENCRLDSQSVGYWFDVIPENHGQRDGLLSSLSCWPWLHATRSRGCVNDGLSCSCSTSLARSHQQQARPAERKPQSSINPRILCRGVLCDLGQWDTSELLTLISSTRRR